jgi:hypothetical protein
MTKLPITPANFPIDASGTATNSALHRAWTIKSPSGLTPRIVSVKVPGSLAPWSVRP